MKKKQETVKRKTLFDHINVITSKSDPDYYKNLSEEDKKTFNVYMIHRFLSMNPSWVEVVNLVQRYSQQLKQEGTFQVYNDLLPKGKIFLKYIKSSNEKEYNEYVMSILKKYFELSYSELRTYYDIFLSTPEKKEELMQILRMYGGNEKELKKLEKELKVKMIGE